MTTTDTAAKLADEFDRSPYWKGRAVLDAWGASTVDGLHLLPNGVSVPDECAPVYATDLNMIALIERHVGMYDDYFEVMHCAGEWRVTRSDAASEKPKIDSGYWDTEADARAFAIILHTYATRNGLRVLSNYPGDQ